jgi:succinoglycan biosynthesis protein ExoW
VLGLSVVIPFYQRQPGILERALRSVVAQQIPSGWSIEIVVVDDGSPVSAAAEARQIDFGDPFHLRIVQQQNQGVAAARNRGLLEASSDSGLIAFLDSDDIWPPEHLNHAVSAVEQGFDFYFADNRRANSHESYCRTSTFARQTASFISASAQKNGFLEVPKDLMIGLTLAEFPCQASTVVYRRSIASKLLFDSELEYTGEDVLFFVTLAALANRICLDLDSLVECGSGVNIYFANLSPNDSRFLPIKVDKYVTHFRIGKRFELSGRNKEWNENWLAQSRKDLVYHLARGVLGRPAQTFRAFVRLTRIAPRAAAATPWELLYLALGRIKKKLHTAH